MTDTNTLDLSGLPPAGGADSTADGVPQIPPVRKTLRGSLAHLGLSIPPEHIAEAQRECWATMPPITDDS